MVIPDYTVPALDVDIDEVRRTFETNLFSVMRITKEFMPLLIKAQGTVVQIGSVAGVVPYVFGSSYNATKAALHSYSNTLRLEVAPYGYAVFRLVLLLEANSVYRVKVTVVVTGGVQSRIARTERTLPADSLYLPINDDYQRRVVHSQDGALSNAAYARSVVNKVLVRRPPDFIWEGNKSWVVWFVQSFLPFKIWSYVFPRMFGLDRLAKLIAAKRNRPA
jgi:1-acylglycerone phosphate reductase